MIILFYDRKPHNGFGRYGLKMGENPSNGWLLDQQTLCDPTILTYKEFMCYLEIKLEN
jgi:hypothetical protein